MQHAIEFPECWLLCENYSQQSHYNKANKIRLIFPRRLDSWMIYTKMQAITNWNINLPVQMDPLHLVSICQIVDLSI